MRKTLLTVIAALAIITTLSVQAYAEDRDERLGQFNGVFTVGDNDNDNSTRSMALNLTTTVPYGTNNTSALEGTVTFFLKDWVRVLQVDSSDSFVKYRNAVDHHDSAKVRLFILTEPDEFGYFNSLNLKGERSDGKHNYFGDDYTITSSKIKVWNGTQPDPNTPTGFDKFIAFEVINGTLGLSKTSSVLGQ